MQLISPKAKKFWTPAILTQGGGKFIASLTANYISQFDTSNVTGASVNTFDFSLTLPTIPAGSLLVVALLADAFTLTGITFDPAGQNIALTNRGGFTRPILQDGVLSSGASAGSYVFRCTISGGTWQFRRAGITAWYLVGQTVNSPENIAAQASTNTSNVAVIGGRVLLSAGKYSANNTTTWSLSTPNVPSSSHGSGTSLAVAEWQSNITQTANYNPFPTAGGTGDGQITATYI